ncbi:MAG: lipopolysaccharide transport periplasmic protein LptA [Campylobacterales bacterium]|nr:lipopolysaccharide transport periplasmic protein LptA [Campylobacterales bacterium]
MRVWMTMMVLANLLYAEALKVVAEQFQADETTGITLFSGNVQISRGSDEINASEVRIRLDEKRQPIEYWADGNVSFHITAEANGTYSGTAQHAHFIPSEQAYRFNGDVELLQLDQKKRIIGEEVFVNLSKGSAMAVGKAKRPVIMTFELEERLD